MNPRLLFILIALLVIISPVSAQSIIATESNVIYGTDRSRRLDVYLPEGATEPMPVVVMFHGSSGDKSDLRTLGIPQIVVPLGYAAVSVTYTTDIPAAYANAYCALAWVYANAEHYNFDTDRVALFGMSYGGLVVSYLAANDEPEDFQGDCPQPIPAPLEFAGVIADAGAFTLRSDVIELIRADFPEQTDLVAALEATPTADWRSIALDAVPAEVIPYLTYAAPYWLDGSEAPHLLVHGAGDSIVPYQVSLDYAAELLQVRVDTTLVFDRLSGHVAPPRAFDEEMVTFLSRIFD